MLIVEGNAKVSVCRIDSQWQCTRVKKCNFPVAGTAVSLAL